MKLFKLAILVLCIFSGALLAAFFPEDIYRPALFVVLIFEVIALVLIIITFNFIHKHITSIWRQWIVVLLIGVVMLWGNLKFFPCEHYCPSDFLRQYKTLLVGYDELTMNAFTGNYWSEEVVRNNFVLHKFELSAIPYRVDYADVSDTTDAPKRVASFPVWVNEDTVCFDRKTLRYETVGTFILFTDTVEDHVIQFRIGKSGLDEVAKFYTGGGSEIVNGVQTWRSATIDQHHVRIAVSHTNPSLIVNRSYGRLTRFLLKMKK